ncbi:cation diffusion zinc membrane transporter Zrg17 [Exophiala xenobiotica]|nr:cation diffusion zinc membrane transporter Zrg17 [Exophiala xenobiotica]KAK5264979.1 cation diffusion zinc membrane transporter Zrg17 [Exophiala xenobiotica]KAK5333825.1 cation diffusion zinc membrane transporter Zrg17 [Exophiala xenobiotica]KAK5447699.1 cation diffusion zinc membrane transporter Zrg17 [Exophiala xenobiotica]KAK5533739.1 cation diffusion zinc membrane transporter Zrg17 [Chaetothyriales sp. CCFEE 6169]
MASSMPIPIPPRTPTPPPEEPPSPHSHPVADPETPFDNNSLSPLHAERDNMPSLGAALSSPVSPLKSPLKQSTNGAGVFNFQPSAMAKSPVIKSNIGQRRGHKYKHSSVSHQIFLEPPQRAPLALPNSLPIPTFAECRASMTKDQKIRFYWSICHMAVAGYTAWNSHGSAAMEALSHLIFYDSLGALLCVFVEIFSNFEVWGRSSVRHPFGLQRMEVIAGFALSVLLIFFGFDLISHNAKHALEGIGHEPHHPHSHDRITTGTIDLTALLALVSTLISAVGLQNHARIGKAMRFAAMENLPSLLSNPSHFLTLSCSATMLMLPLLSLHTYEWVDKILSLSIALSMLFLGVHLGRNVGAMLLMSLPSKSADVAEVVKAIEAQPLVQSVEQAKFWQAHYGMGMANLRLRVVGTEENLVRLRETITSIIRNRLSGGYGSGSSGQKWEANTPSFEVVTFARQSFRQDGLSRGPTSTPYRTE